MREQDHKQNYVWETGRAKVRYIINTESLNEYMLLMYSDTGYVLTKNEALNLVPIIQELWPDDFKKLDLGSEM